jgi:hypothetical protein
LTQNIIKSKKNKWSLKKYLEPAKPKKNNIAGVRNTSFTFASNPMCINAG